MLQRLPHVRDDEPARATRGGRRIRGEARTTVTIAPAAVDVAREFVDALAARDYERLERCFAPDVEFHAVVPGTGSFREQAGAAATAEQFRKWFDDAEPLEILDWSCDVVVDRVRTSYRFAAREDGQWHVVEQQAYAAVSDSGIERLDLVCSGFRPVAERPG
jgi:ketosteroid isomerase-like protein